MPSALPLPLTPSAKCGPRRPSTGAITVAVPGSSPSATHTISAGAGAPDPKPPADSRKSRA